MRLEFSRARLRMETCFILTFDVPNRMRLERRIARAAERRQPPPKWAATSTISRTFDLTVLHRGPIRMNSLRQHHIYTTRTVYLFTAIFWGAIVSQTSTPSILGTRFGHGMYGVALVSQSANQTIVVLPNDSQGWPEAGMPKCPMRVAFGAYLHHYTSAI